VTGAASAALATTSRAAASDTRTTLDDVEKRLAPGRGKLDLGAFVRGTREGGAAGASLDYEHRLNPSAALFGEGTAGYGWGAERGLHDQATTGLRMRF
jgi:sugar phosphate isomerase/epimerase